MTTTTELLGALIARRTSAADEGEIIRLFEKATTPELNAMIVGNAMHELFDSVDDRVLGQDNRRRLVQILARTRRRELSVMSAAGVVFGLQHGWSGREDELAIRDILLATDGEELTRLKNQINSRTDAHDLEGLVFSAIDDAEIRTQVLDHIATQARTVPWREAKVLCDIDDTVFCKLHDDRYPKGIVYPGVLALLEELDQGPARQPMSLGDLTFVTARPADAFGLIENTTRATLRKAGIGTSSVLSGSFLGLHSLDAMAGRKLTNVEHYRQLYPEYDQVFLGDSGQGDIIVGKEMWSRWPDTVRAVFIHDVVDTSDEERRELARQRIVLHDTYVGCALQAWRQGLIGTQGLTHVLNEAQSQFDAIAWEDEEQRLHMNGVFDRDTNACRSALQGASA